MTAERLRDKDAIEIEEVLAASSYEIERDRQIQEQLPASREFKRKWEEAHPDEAERLRRALRENWGASYGLSKAEIRVIADRIRQAKDLDHWGFTDEAVEPLARLAWTYQNVKRVDWSMRNARDPERRAFGKRTRELMDLQAKTLEIGGDVGAVSLAIRAHLDDGEARKLCRGRYDECVDLRSTRYTFGWDWKAEALCSDSLYETGGDTTVATLDNMPTKRISSKLRRNTTPTKNVLWVMTRVMAEIDPTLSAPMRARAVAEVLAVGAGRSISTQIEMDAMEGEAAVVLAQAGKHTRPSWIVPIERE